MAEQLSIFVTRYYGRTDTGYQYGPAGSEAELLALVTTDNRRNDTLTIVEVRLPAGIKARVEMWSIDL